LKGSAVFKTAPFDRSGTPPAGQCNYAETRARRGAPWRSSTSGTA
jgi:hypothetical protein